MSGSDGKFADRIIGGCLVSTVYPVRRQCLRFQAPDTLRQCRANYDRDPLGGRANALLSINIVTGGTFIFSLLAVTVTLSLRRPHGSYVDTRPEAHVGIKVTASIPSHPSKIQSWGGGKGEVKRVGKKRRNEICSLLSHFL